MSREIKFRAWDARNKKYYYMDKSDFIIERDGVSVFSEYSESRINKSWELEQFAGLHDKNDKEIYEGDIVQTIDQMEATYNELDSNVGVGEVEVLHGFWNVGGHVCNGLYDLDDMYHIEVIGNVHENPELLEAGE